MNYKDFKELMAQAIKNEDVKALIPEFIQQGQKLLERKLRVRAMEYFPAAGTITAGNNTLALPSDYIELIYFAFVDGTQRYPIFDKRGMRLHIDSMRRSFADTTNTGRPTTIVRRGDNLEFNRYTDKQYSYEWGYFKNLTTLTNEADTNWWTSNASDALLFASLVCAAPLLPPVETRRGLVEDPRKEGWTIHLDMLIGDIIRTDNRERMSGGNKRVRYQD